MARLFDVVEYPDEMRNELVHKFPESGSGDFHIGTQLIVRAELSWRDDGGLGVFACELKNYDGDVLARALVKGYVPEDIRDHLGDTLDA